MIKVYDLIFTHNDECVAILCQCLHTSDTEISSGTDKKLNILCVIESGRNIIDNSTSIGVFKLSTVAI